MWWDGWYHSIPVQKRTLSWNSEAANFMCVKSDNRKWQRICLLAAEVSYVKFLVTVVVPLIRVTFTDSGQCTYKSTVPTTWQVSTSNNSLSRISVATTRLWISRRLGFVGNLSRLLFFYPFMKESRLETVLGYTAETWPQWLSIFWPCHKTNQPIADHLGKALLWFHPITQSNVLRNKPLKPTAHVTACDSFIGLFEKKKEKEKERATSL